MGKYILNQETQKIELHFAKAEYMALSEEQKKEIKSHFLWSGKAGAWVSRSIHYHYRAVQIAEKLGLENGGKEGERLSYAEELERKSEKAERRAERYEQYSENAEKRAENLQSEFNRLRKDWSWLTQPIIPGHAGSRAFGNHKAKVMARYEKGFEEYEKSDYYKERAATARATADNAKLKDRVYLHNRIKEQNSILKKLQESIVAAENNLYKLQQGEEVKAWDGSLLTVEGQEERIERTLEKYEWEHDKLEFFEKCLDELGGIQFSKDNIKVGYIVNMKRWGRCEILSAGPVNVTFKILDGGASGGVLTETYAAIVEIIQAKEKTAKVENPFKVGDILCKYYGMESRNGVYKAFQIVKITATGIKIQQIAVENRKPVPDRFIGEPTQKKVTKSKCSDWVGISDDGWRLDKYEEKEMAGAV
jgi:hypothetical protein